MNEMSLGTLMQATRALLSNDVNEAANSAFGDNAYFKA